MTKPIMLQVDADVADAFNQASASQQQMIQSVISLWLKYMAQPNSLEEIVDQIRTEAASNGLTPDILAGLLQDD
jgi:hemoglobin-like flavoprotein